MSVIKATDLAHVRFSLPDLDVAEQFVREFGLRIVRRDDESLYAGGTTDLPFLYAAHRGPPKFLGLAFEAASADDLERIASHDGVSPEELNGPDGGQRVILTDPDGFQVEVVAGRRTERVIPSAIVPGFNRGMDRGRVNSVKRVGVGPSQVLRLGHVVLKVTNFRRSEAWYKERFGLITSDEIEVAPDQSIGAFMRADRGETPSDHHTLFLLETGAPEFEHAAFEVPDFDDLMRGSTHLTQAKRQHAWGVGRHILGSQVFDYWRDPWGFTLEHWTDGDVMDAAWGSRKAPLNDLLGVQWGQTFLDAHPLDRLPG